MTTFERRITMRGAFDRRHPDPKQNYGIHGMEIRFTLIGEWGATQFLVYTPIHLRHVADELWEKANRRYNPFEAAGADIGYHALHPHYEGQEEYECDLLPGGKCFYDGSGLAADEFLPEFVAGGSDVVWPMLEERYHKWFPEPAPVEVT